MVFVSLNSNTTGVTCVAGTATLPEHSVFSGVRVARSLVFCVMFCRSLLVLLSFYCDHCVVWPSVFYGF